jgi:hypothetical protein
MKFKLKISILFLFATLSAFSQVHFRYGKYIRYDGLPIDVNFSSSSNSHINYPDFDYRSDWADYNNHDISLKLFIKYGKCSNKLSKPFVFVEGVSFEKPIKTNTYTLNEYLNMKNTDQQISNNPILVSARDSVAAADWLENATVGYSTFNWATLVTGIDAEGVEDGEPLQVQKSPELLQKLYDAGYDIVFVDFESGQQYMENNGLALSKALKQIKDSLDFNGSAEKLVVCGASMGGIVSRFAIRDLELNGANKYKDCVGKFISFDSPQMGANINLGMQYFLQNLKGTSIIPLIPNADMIRDKYTKLTCPSASQLVLYSCLADPIDWYSPMKFSTAGPSLERTLFNNHPNALTWPINCRKYAIINGSRNGIRQNNGSVQSCQTMFDGDGVFNVNIQSLPNYGDGYCKIYDFEMPNVGCMPSYINYFTNNSVRVRNSRGVDIVAGSFRSDLNRFTFLNHWVSSLWAGNIDPCNIPSYFTPATTQAPNYCFIPALSAAGIINFEALVENSHIALPLIFQGSARLNDPNHAISHFDVVYAPEQNQTHVEITDENIAWVMQILNDTEAEHLLFQNETPEARIHSADKTIRAGNNVGKYPGCTITSLTPSGTYTTTNVCGPVTLQAHAQTIFRAGERITLEPGFVTSTHSNFLAEIKQMPTCATNFNRMATGSTSNHSNNDHSRDILSQKDIYNQRENAYEKKQYASTQNKSRSTIFPNPTRSNFTISSPEPIVQFSIFDVSGKLVLKQENVGTSMHEVSTENLLEGIYFVMVNTSNQNETLKLVIEKQ